jgi:hypothetical protein
MTHRDRSGEWAFNEVELRNAEHGKEDQPRHFNYE